MSKDNKGFHDVDLNLPIDGTGAFSLTIDGQPIKNVRDIHINGSFLQPTVVTVEILANVKAKVQAEKVEIKEVEG